MAITINRHAQQDELFQTWWQENIYSPSRKRSKVVSITWNYHWNWKLPYDVVSKFHLLLRSDFNTSILLSVTCWPIFLALNLYEINANKTKYFLHYPELDQVDKNLDLTNDFSDPISESHAMLRDLNANQLKKTLASFKTCDHLTDACEEHLSRCIAFSSWIFNDSIGIRVKNAMHLGKKLLAAVFHVIVWSVRQ